MLFQTAIRRHFTALLLAAANHRKVQKSEVLQASFPLTYVDYRKENAKKPNYKNWVPKILIACMAAATVLSLASLIVFGFCGLCVTKTWRIVLSILFALAAVGSSKTLLVGRK